MVTYQQLKDWFKEKENKNRLILGVCFILVFLVGFGSGSYEKETKNRNTKPYTNYTTSAAKKPITQTPPAGEPAKLKATSTPNCIVKGNIAANGKKVYHVQGGAFYKIVKPEQCFNTQAEALDAGFVKSSR